MHTAVIILVLLVLLSGYGGMHYYLYRKVRRIFPHHKKAVAAILTLLAMSLFLVQALMHTGLAPGIYQLAWIPSIWIGYVFLFFVIAGTADLLIRASSLILKNYALARIPAARRTIVLGMVVALVCIGGFLSAQQIIVRSYTLTSPKLQRPLALVQITDLHLDMLSNADRLQQLVDTVNALRPDIVVSTGDLIDMQADNLDGVSSVLESLRAPLGKYAVYGNHEAFAGIEKARAFLSRSGFTVLSNRGIGIGHTISIVGVDDPAVQRRIKTDGDLEKQVLEKLPRKQYTVLLKHQPIVTPGSSPLFDLQLSGHTHGGQIFPFGLLVRLFYRAPYGLSHAGPESWLYVSNGAGTWGPPIRVLAEPEITVFYLQPAGNQRHSHGSKVLIQGS